MQHEQELIDAIMAGNEARLSGLLRAADDVSQILREQVTNPRPTNHSFGSGMTLLQLASYRRRGDGDAASVLLKHGAKIDLHSACGLGMTDRIVEILETEPKSIDESVGGYFPIQFAITGSKAAAVSCLCEHGDDPNRDLRKVAYFGWEDDIRNDDYTPWKPIHMASLYGFDSSRIPVADALAAAGADLNSVSPLDGSRPIHLATMSNRVEMIRFFVSQGVDVDSRTASSVGVEIADDNAGPISGFGCTPMMIAAAEGFPEATASLLELGSDPMIKNDRSMTAMDFAKKRFWDGQPYEQVIRLLEDVAK